MFEAPTEEARRWRLVALTALGILGLLLIGQLIRLLSGNDREVAAPELPAIAFEAVSYGDVPGWTGDNHAEAVAPFLLTCERIMARESDAAANPLEALGLNDIVSLSGTVSDWAGVCEAANDLPLSDEAVRRFFEVNFQPVRIMQPGEDESGQLHLSTQGLFTGYFEPVYPASYEATEEHTVPVLARPGDLVMVDLGAFREDLAGKRIAGRIKEGRLLPYADHRKIVEQGLETESLGWMNPNDLLFLQIQGSGKLRFPDTEIRVGYAAQNGHPYTAIGGPLIRNGEIPREEMSMQAIYNWLDAASAEDAASLRYLNESYVFFRQLDNLPDPELGPVGASTVQLTPGRSLAVDRRYHVMGAPIWLDIEGLEAGTRLQRLMIAQDTGGAIKGPVRGDVYVGSGREAGDMAGVMRQEGQLFVLLPKSVFAKLEQVDGQAYTEH